MKLIVTREQTFYEVFEVEVDPEDYSDTGTRMMAESAAIDMVDRMSFQDRGSVEQIDEGYRGDYTYEVE